MRFLAFFILIIFFWSCQDIKYPEKPKDLIGKDKMVDILTEAYLANAARSIDNKKIVASAINMDSILYTKFGVDSLQFAKSNAYYAADVNVYLSLFQDVENRLNAMQQNLDSIRKASINYNDSIPDKLQQGTDDPSKQRLPNL